jgi:hypothetical protein
MWMRQKIPRNETAVELQALHAHTAVRQGAASVAYSSHSGTLNKYRRRVHDSFQGE